MAHAGKQLRKVTVDGVQIGWIEREFNPEGFPLISDMLVINERLADPRGMTVNFVDESWTPDTQGEIVAQAHEEYAGTNEEAGPIHHERPAQRTATVSIEGLPVGWAKVTVGSAEEGSVKISQIVINDGRIEPDSNFFFGVSDDDETPQVNVPGPREPGFYRYSDGAQTMMFLLKDNRETNRFFAQEGINPQERENDWQWYVILDNGQTDRCEWGYIEQALVSGNELVKIV